MTRKKKNDRAAWERRVLLEDTLAAEHAEKVVALVRLHKRKAIDLHGPTHYPPGSKWKQAVIAARHAIGSLTLHVPGDVNHNESCLVHCTTLPLDRPTFAACQIHEVFE